MKLMSKALIQVVFIPKFDPRFENSKTAWYKREQIYIQCHQSFHIFL